jgi:hypothetical protein
MHKLQCRLPVILIVLSFLLPIPAAQADHVDTDPQSIETATDTLSPLTDSIIADELTYLGDYHMDPDQETELVKREYVPPSPEVIALTKAQVQSFDCSTVTDVSQNECEALVALYNSTNGAGWSNNTNWLVSTSVDSWWEVTVSVGHVSKLSLTNNHLTGNIPPELGNLPGLTQLLL